MRSESRRPDGGYDMPILSKTLMKSVWGAELTEEVKTFRTKMVTAMLVLEVSAKGNSSELEIKTRRRIQERKKRKDCNR